MHDLTHAFNSQEPSGKPEHRDCLYRLLLDGLHDGVYFVDRERVITYWNQGADRLSGYTESEAIGRKCFDNFLRHVDEQGNSLCLNGCPLSSTLEDGGTREDELYLQHKNGHRVPVWVRVTPIKDGNGQITGAVEVFSDVSAKKLVERRAVALEQIAFKDTLTGLPNRRYTELKLKQALEEVATLSRNIGVIFIDLDHFKGINDTFGHLIGDEVLRTVSKTLSLSLRPDDVVGRWGGEEFVAIVRDVSLQECTSLAERCRRLLSNCAINPGGLSVTFTASLGATIAKVDDDDVLLMDRVDKLMYASKCKGRNRVTAG